MERQLSRGRDALALASALLCAALLAACGSSDSGTATTKTATVPAGTLGAAMEDTCPVPTDVPGATFHSFDVKNQGCGDAEARLKEFYARGRVSGWTCQPRTSGRLTAVRCVQAFAGIDDPDEEVAFSASWTTG